MKILIPNLRKTDFYVDDLITGGQSVEKGHGLYKRMIARFMEAHFNIRKWRTNSKELRSKMASDDILNDETAKVLGIKWNNLKDTMQLGVKEIFISADKIEPSTRNILKIIAAIYDPIGFLAPVTITLKLLFQEICVANIGWDESIGMLEKKWVNFVYDIYDPITSIVLHSYSDAAKKAFAACIYIQGVTKSGNV